MIVDNNLLSLFILWMDAVTVVILTQNDVIRRAS